MYDKQYILRMMDLLEDKEHQNPAAIEGIFAGISPLSDDKEVQKKLVKSLKLLVEKDVYSAEEAEKLVRKYFPILIDEPERPFKTFMGPFRDAPKLAFDHGRMGRDWINKLEKATPEERNKMLRPHLDAK